MKRNSPLLQAVGEGQPVPNITMAHKNNPVSFFIFLNFKIKVFSPSFHSFPSLQVALELMVGKVLFILVYLFLMPLLMLLTLFYFTLRPLVKTHNGGVPG